MGKYYQITGFTKFAEIDVFQDGCQPESGQSHYFDSLIQNTDIDSLIETAMGLLGVEDKKNVILNACEDIGRIDLMAYERDSGLSASESDMAQWRDGKLQLWSVIYTAHITQIMESDIDLTGLVSNPENYGV
jgi:hypothetical protein